MGPSDDELMRNYRDTRDPHAFDSLFQRHGTRVYRYACGMLGCPVSAEEVLQEVFLTLIQSAHRYQPRGCFGTWLLRITRNRCLNHLESQRLRRIASTDGAGEEPASPKPGPLQQVVAADQFSRVQQAILRLPAPQREAILLYAMQDMDYRHIAQVLDVPVNTVKALIYRARLTLAKNTQDCEP